MSARLYFCLNEVHHFHLDDRNNCRTRPDRLPITLVIDYSRCHFVKQERYESPQALIGGTGRENITVQVCI